MNKHRPSLALGAILFTFLASACGSRSALYDSGAGSHGGGAWLVWQAKLLQITVARLACVEHE